MVGLKAFVSMVREHLKEETLVAVKEVSRNGELSLLKGLEKAIPFGVGS